MDESQGSRSSRTIPGVIRVVTTQPVELPASAAEGQSSLAEQLEDRPWLVAAAIAALAAGFVVVVVRRRS